MVTLFFIGGMFLVVLIDQLVIKRLEPRGGAREVEKGGGAGKGEA